MKRVLIKTHKLDDVIAKGENAGKIGLFIDKKPIPDIAKQGDFPMNPRVKSLRAKFPVRDGVLSKNKYEQVKYKENQTQLSGKESKIIDNFEYDGKKPLPLVLVVLVKLEDTIREDKMNLVTLKHQTKLCLKNMN